MSDMLIDDALLDLVVALEDAPTGNDDADPETGEIPLEEVPQLPDDAIVALIDQYDNLGVARDLIMAPFARQIAEIETQRAAATAELDEKLALLKATIDAQVLRRGATVRGAHLRVEFRKGQRRFLAAPLDKIIKRLRKDDQNELASEIAACQSVGNPTTAYVSTGK